MITPPNLEGTCDGILSASFGTPVSDVRFGLHFSASGTFPNSLAVRFFDVNGVLFDTQFRTTSPTPPPAGFAGILFQQAQGVPIKSIEIDPLISSATAPRFVVDNLTFTPVPEPATISAVLAGLLLMRSRTRP